MLPLQLLIAYLPCMCESSLPDLSLVFSVLHLCVLPGDRGAGKPVSQQEWQKALQLTTQIASSSIASADGSEQSWHRVWQLLPTSGSPPTWHLSPTSGSPPPGVSHPLVAAPQTFACFSTERLTQGPYTLPRVSMVG